MGMWCCQKKFPLDVRKAPMRAVQCWDRAQKRGGICILGDSTTLNKTLGNLPWPSRQPWGTPETQEVPPAHTFP